MVNDRNMKRSSGIGIAIKGQIYENTADDLRFEVSS